MVARVDIYTRRHCSYSQRAKELLRIKGVKFVEHDITDALLETAERRPRIRVVPDIYINDVSIGSCHELFEMDERGALDPLLAQAISPAESFQSA